VLSSQKRKGNGIHDRRLRETWVSFMSSTLLLKEKLGFCG